MPSHVTFVDDDGTDIKVVKLTRKTNKRKRKNVFSKSLFFLILVKKFLEFKVSTLDDIIQFL